MRAAEFCYWLQGYFELREPGPISEQQAEIVERHLALVFKHELDPQNDGGDPKKAAALQAAHDGPRPPSGHHGGGIVYRC